MSEYSDENEFAREKEINEEEEIYCSYETLANFNNQDILEAKFNVMTAIQPKAFEKENYKPEEKVVLKNDKNEDEVKEIPLNNYIRWRNVNKSQEDEMAEKEKEREKPSQLLGFKKTDKSKKMESNARIVEWSDGSLQLIIGEECFDVMLSTMDNIRLGIKDPVSQSIVINKPVKHRMLLTPSEFSTGVKKVEKVIDADESNLKVKLAYSYYDKQSYNKDEFSNKFMKKNPKEEIKKINPDKLFKKRKRSTNSFDY